jgi:hypothetical protein
MIKVRDSKSNLSVERAKNKTNFRCRLKVRVMEYKLRVSTFKILQRIILKTW